MTISTIEIIRERVKSATEDSPIAVFKEKRGDIVHLNSVFANTIFSQKAIENNADLLVGIYHKKTNTALMVSELKAAEVKKSQA